MSPLRTWMLVGSTSSTAVFGALSIAGEVYGNGIEITPVTLFLGLLSLGSWIGYIGALVRDSVTDAIGEQVEYLKKHIDQHFDEKIEALGADVLEFGDAKENKGQMTAYRDIAGTGRALRLAPAD
jgi:hypothetical protein